MDDLVDLLDSDDDITPKSNESSVCVQQRNEKMFDKQNEAEEEKENSKRAEILMKKKNSIYCQMSGREKLEVTVFRVLHHIFSHSFQVPTLMLLVYHSLKQ